MEARKIILCSTLVCACFGLYSPCVAGTKVDRLYLCGKIIEVDPSGKKMLVKVVSEGCVGEKTFNVKDVQLLEQFTEGEDDCFMIDADSCPKERIATILSK